MLSQGAAFAGLGLVGGILGAWVMMRLISRLLFDVSATDPAAFAGAAAMLVAVSTLASYIPARKAAAVDPLIALRDE
jgi:putative ABC transport system permease protein